MLVTKGVLLMKLNEFHEMELQMSKLCSILLLYLIVQCWLANIYKIMCKSSVSVLEGDGVKLQRSTDQQVSSQHLNASSAAWCALRHNSTADSSSLSLTLSANPALPPHPPPPGSLVLSSIHLLIRREPRM